MFTVLVVLAGCRAKSVTMLDREPLALQCALLSALATRQQPCEHTARTLEVGGRFAAQHLVILYTYISANGIIVASCCVLSKLGGDNPYL